MTHAPTTDFDATTDRPKDAQAFAHVLVGALGRLRSVPRSDYPVDATGHCAEYEAAKRESSRIWAECVERIELIAAHPFEADALEVAEAALAAFRTSEAQARWEARKRDTVALGRIPDSLRVDCAGTLVWYGSFDFDFGADGTASGADGLLAFLAGNGEEHPLIARLILNRFLDLYLSATTWGAEARAALRARKAASPYPR